MALLRLLTTGAIGEADLLAQQRAQGRNITSLSVLAYADEDLESAILDILANPPWTLHLDTPFAPDEIRTTPHTESHAYAHIKARLRAFLERAKDHTHGGEDDGIILGREYGLTLVPMQAQYREEIRRMAELTALTTPHVDTYHIHFAGGLSLTVKAPPPPLSLKVLRDTTPEERAWHEDAAHDNGNYYNTCHHCGRTFVGHKRRVTCRVCATEELAAQAQVDAITQYYRDRNRAGWAVPRHKTASDAAYTDIVSDAGMDPRNRT